MRLEEMDETALWDCVNRGRQNGWVFSRLKTLERCLRQHYMSENTCRRSMIKGRGPREKMPEILRQAVREAATNAFAHMDWMLGGVVLGLAKDGPSRTADAVRA